MERSAGILLPVFSLPSPYGIGTLGKQAREFIDFLAAAGQRWWQMLPLGPTGYGDSPYQSLSSFAGNPYLIDLDALVADGLLQREELAAAAAQDRDGAAVDYGRLYETRLPLLRAAARRGLRCPDAEYETFCAEHASWLDDYALFTAIKAQFGGAAWYSWSAEYRQRLPVVMARFSEAHAAELAEIKMIQYLFFRQFRALRQYASERKIGFIGDLPFYAAADSADVWSRQTQFLLRTDGAPSAVAGVPPDYFSEEGQLWGNPLYHWDRMTADGYAWWRERVAAAASRCDMLRLDHFRAVESYWAVPADAHSAREGEWRRGPGMPFLDCLNRSFPQLRFLAEDLGILTPAVAALREAAGWPGMKVLQFAFSDGENGAYLPRSAPEAAVCYIGTHDNETLCSWAQALPPRDRRFACRYLGVSTDAELPDAVLRAGMLDGAQIFISRLQDWLDLDDAARINTPGVSEGSWRWRMTREMLSPALAARIADMTCAAGRD